MILNQNLHASSKPVNKHDCVWKNLCQFIMRTTLQEKADTSLQHYNLVHKFIPMQNSRNKSSSGEIIGKKWKRFRRRIWLKSEVRKDVIDGWGDWGPRGMSITGGGGLARVPNLRVCEHPFTCGVAHAGEEGWINILPWYRPVGVAKTSSETQKRKSRAARKGKWPPRGAGTTILTYPRSTPRGTNKAGENGHNSGEVGGSSVSAPEVWWHTQGC